MDSAGQRALLGARRHRGTRSGQWSYYVMAGFAMLALCPLAHATDVEVSVSDKEVYFGQSFFLQFEVQDPADTSIPQLPDIPGARVAFVGTSQQFSISNGRREQTMTHRFQVTPDAAGTFRIAPFEFRLGSRSFRFGGAEVEVIRSETGDLLFVELKADRDRYYVGEKVGAVLEVWVRPYRDRQYNVKLDVDDMRTLFDEQSSQWGVFGEKLRQRLRDNLALPGERRQRDLGNGVKREYYVYSIRHEFWADQPGTFDVGDIRIVYEYPEALTETRDLFSSFFERGNLRIASSKPLVGEVSALPLKILPLPDDERPEIFNGAVGKYDIKVAAKPTTVRVGDPITLTLTISGQGRLDSLQAPPLEDVAALTADFTVPSEPLAGTVQGDLKQFTQTIRARDETVTEIPAIPMSFFDPDKESYQTVWSRPIPLQVSKAERLASGAIVEAPTPGDVTAPSSTLTAVQEGLVANYHDVDALLSQQEFRPTVGTAMAVAVPPAAVAGVWLVSRRVRKSRTDAAGMRQRQARRKADRLLSATADSLSSTDVGPLLMEYMTDRLNLPPGARTPAEIAQAMEVLKLAPEIRSQWRQLLDEVESLVYGGRQAVSGQLLKRIQDAIRELERRR